MFIDFKSSTLGDPKHFMIFDSIEVALLPSNNPWFVIISAITQPKDHTSTWEV